MMELKYRRVLLKLSGEALAGEKKVGIDPDIVEKICASIKLCVEKGVAMGIVIGGGNIWRGRHGKEMDRTRADHMGMLATVINALALQDALERAGVPTRVQTAIEMRQITEPYIRNKAISHFSKGRVVIFACGTGNPFFTTDTTAALRAAEMDAEILLLAKNVDGVYSADPRQDKNAVRFDDLSYLEVIDRGLGVMDSTATTLCMDNRIPILVFALSEPENIIRAVCGQAVGTLVH
ncbi:MAG: UMP kinase [Clostridia bacterium]|nr:UMP kinase [Clostridia bacterium]